MWCICMLEHTREENGEYWVSCFIFLSALFCETGCLTGAGIRLEAGSTGSCFVLVPHCAGATGMSMAMPRFLGRGLDLN